MKTKKFKTKLQEVIKQKGITNVKSMQLEVPEERFLIALRSILASVNSRKIDSFLKEYEKLIFRKNIPIFSFDTVTLLYRRWLKCADVCALLIYFSKKIGAINLSEEVWESIIYKSYYSSGDRELLLNRYFLLVQLFKQRIFTKQLFQELIPSVQNVLSLKLPKKELESRRKAEQILLVNYKVFFIWSELIVRLFAADSKKLNKVFERMLVRHFSFPIENEISHEKFTEYIVKLNQFVNYKYILNYSFKDLLKVYEIYKVNPHIFEEEWIALKKFSTHSIFKMIFSRFKLSNLFIQNYFNLTLKEKSWLVHILKRNSLKSANHLPLPLTKKATHVFLNIEEDLDLSVKEGLVYSSLLSLDVNKGFAMGVLRNIRNFAQSGFWVKTMSQFYHKGLTSDNIGDTMDYINQCHYLDNRKINWKQKSCKNVLKETENWHVEITKQHEIRRQKYNQFKNSTISDFFEIGIDNGFIIKQLKNLRDLYLEGGNLNHCVYSYARNCKSGYCEIFSLRQVDLENNETPLLTIEVRGRRILQVKGNFNRKPFNLEWDIIRRWASEEDIRIAC
ncbi:MAG: PcfJ domain-containing protein [Flavobacteriales bacterium]|nr:PcfJ domain-containing protein [Flavobacteriales bacterium]